MFLRRSTSQLYSIDIVFHIGAISDAQSTALFRLNNTISSLGVNEWIALLSTVVWLVWKSDLLDGKRIFIR